MAHLNRALHHDRPLRNWSYFGYLALALLLCWLIPHTTVFAEQVTARKGSITINDTYPHASDHTDAQSVTRQMDGEWQISSLKFTPPNHWKFKKFSHSSSYVHIIPSSIDSLAATAYPELSSKIKVIWFTNSQPVSSDHFKLAAEGNLQHPQGHRGHGGHRNPSYWAATIKVPKIKLQYIGGTNAGNGDAEGIKTLKKDDYLKGYMLKMSTPAIATGTKVTWKVEKNGKPVGTWHQDLKWPDYDNNLPTIPTDQTVYWRSDTAGSITDQYTITATYTPKGASKKTTIQRVIKSRLLVHDQAPFNNQYNADVDMLQRLLIQLFYLDKGRLSSYRIGKYDMAKPPGDTNPPRFYISSATFRTWKNWSSDADEVWNFDHFARGTAHAISSYNLTLPILKSMWDEFDLILKAPEPNPINENNPQYPAWLKHAVETAKLSIPRSLATPENIIKYQDRREDSATHKEASHCYGMLSPLAVSNIGIGENGAGNKKAGTYHTFTDAGLGFGKVQPWNRGAYNIYNHEKNLDREAEIVESNIQDAKNKRIWAPNEIIWRALFKYNNGSFHASQSAKRLRQGKNGAAAKRSADYADWICDKSGVKLP